MKDQLTPLKETGIYIVEVPATATHPNICYGSDGALIVDYWYKVAHSLDVGKIQLPKANWQILGTIEKDKISFDPAPYLDKHYFTEGDKERQCYKCYDENNHKNAYWDTAVASFRSLLTSCGIEVSNKLHLVLLKK